MAVNRIITGQSLNEQEESFTLSLRPKLLDECIGQQNVKGPEGATCMSGECRSKSGVDQGIKFLYGCSGDGLCNPQGYHEAVSVNQYCYKPSQKQDNDNTDLTVGCFCR